MSSGSSRAIMLSGDELCMLGIPPLSVDKSDSSEEPERDLRDVFSDEPGFKLAVVCFIASEDCEEDIEVIESASIK
jgi:hypothetical protein